MKKINFQKSSIYFIYLNKYTNIIVEKKQLLDF